MIPLKDDITGIDPKMPRSHAAHSHCQLVVLGMWLVVIRLSIKVCRMAVSHLGENSGSDRNVLFRNAASTPQHKG